jgi:hypothetical protein
MAGNLGMRRGSRGESQRPRHFSTIRDFQLADVIVLRSR